MRLNHPDQSCHLSYCTNIHASETWPDVLQSLEQFLPGVRSSVCAPDQPFGLGLRLAASASDTLTTPAAREQLRDLLLRNNSYLFTINGFPYGTFHGTTVKEGAYRPDWTDPRRLHYTNDLATLLDQFLDDTVTGSISTVPGTFKPWLQRHPEHKQVIARQLVSHVAHLLLLKRSSGHHIELALEPEPCCMLETIDETVDFFERCLLSGPVIEHLASLARINRSEAENAIREHIGVCYDVCHAAVEFEHPTGSIDALLSRGIRISKVQLSSALRLTDMTPERAELLRPFDEPVYLHQVVQRAPDGTLTRFVDLSDALPQAGQVAGAEWRVHFHVPIFLEQMASFDTTQHFLKTVLQRLRRQAVSPHLEVETYTWDVLPERYRNVPVDQAIAREIHWVLSEFESAGPDHAV